MMDFFDHEPSIREKIEVGNQELSFLRILLCCFVACCLQRGHTRRKQRVVWYSWATTVKSNIPPYALLTTFPRRSVVEFLRGALEWWNFKPHLRSS